MRKFLSDEAKIVNDTEDKYMFELKSIVIHRGGAHGGHYFSYIKDDLNEGNWYLEKDIKVEETPDEIKRKGYIPEDHMSEQQLKELEEEKMGKQGKKSNK
jgi:ubiquitin carboxyl-terminal hydrolase 40